MPAVPLGLSAYERQAGFRPEVELENLYLEKDESGSSPDQWNRIQRPGLSSPTALNGPIRGLFQQDGVFSGATFANTPSHLYANGAIIGAVGAGSRVAYAASGTDRLRVVGNTSLYSYDGTNVVAIAMPDAVPVTDIDSLNGYTLIGTPSGRFYWLEPGSDTVDALDFANAESQPDGNVAVCRLGDEIWFFGSKSVEPWQATGDQDLPFIPVPGRQYERGCLARDTVQRFDNSIVWVGENCVVYKAAGVPQRISNNGIEERLRKRGGGPSAWVYELCDGHLFYVLKIPGQGTWAYDAETQSWSKWTSDGFPEFRPHVCINTPSGAFVGDELTATIWELDPEAATDDGEPVRRRVTGTVPIVGKPPRNDSFAVGIGCSADCTVNVRWKDGQTGYPAFPEVLEARAPTDIVTLYRLGIPDQPFRTFEIEITDPVRISIAGAVANEGWF